MPGNTIDYNGTVVTPDSVSYNGSNVTEIILNGTSVWLHCYTAGTNTQLYTNTSGESSVGEGFWRTIETWSATRCGTFNLSGTYVVSNYPSKTIYIGIFVNGTEVERLHTVSDGAYHTVNGTYNHNLATSVSSGATITLQAYLWGNWGSDRTDSSSMTVKVN
jgi:hypothetical protein